MMSDMRGRLSSSANSCIEDPRTVIASGPIECTAEAGIVRRVPPVPTIVSPCSNDKTSQALAVTLHDDFLDFPEPLRGFHVDDSAPD